MAKTKNVLCMGAKYCKVYMELVLRHHKISFPRIKFFVTNHGTFVTSRKKHFFCFAFAIVQKSRELVHILGKKNPNGATAKQKYSMARMLATSNKVWRNYRLLSIFVNSIGGKFPLCKIGEKDFVIQRVRCPHVCTLRHRYVNGVLWDPYAVYLSRSLLCGCIGLQLPSFHLKKGSKIVTYNGGQNLPTIHTSLK